jgi:hypothetical protein
MMVRFVPKLAWCIGVLGAALLYGCPQVTPPEGDGGHNGAFCETREQCPAGQVCTAEKYCADCESSGQCRLKEECRIDSEAGTQRCQLREGWGTECVLNEDCQAGQWCVQGRCKTQSEVKLCPSGSREECALGERCNPVNLVCEEDLGCAEDADCGAQEVCNTGSHACVPRCTLETQAQVCAPGERCVYSRCVQCEKDADCSAGLVCDAAGRCATTARCYQDRDCKVPKVCYLLTGACVDKPPPCTSDENCAPDLRCNLATGRCVPRDCQPDRFEKNDEASTATGIAASLYVGLTLCQNDVDWYAISLARGDRLGVNVEADPYSEGTFTTQIRDASGRVLANGRLLVSYVAPVAQTYYVTVATSDPYQLYDIRFLLTRGTPCDDDAHEPNDQPQDAVPLRKAASIDGTICPQDQDHFSETVPEGKGIVATLGQYDSGQGLLRLCLLLGQTELDCSEALEAPTVTASAQQVAGQTVLVRVSGANERIANSYTLEVSLP